MQIRVIRFGAGGRRGGLALAALAVVLGGVFLMFGLMLLAALAVVGTVAGAGALLLRALRGPRRAQEATFDALPLDPALEVRPLDDAKRLPGS